MKVIEYPSLTLVDLPNEVLTPNEAIKDADFSIGNLKFIVPNADKYTGKRPFLFFVQFELAYGDCPIEYLIKDEVGLHLFLREMLPACRDEMICKVLDEADGFAHVFDPETKGRSVVDDWLPSHFFKNVALISEKLSRL